MKSAARMFEKATRSSSGGSSPCMSEKRSENDHEKEKRKKEEIDMEKIITV